MGTEIALPILGPIVLIFATAMVVVAIKGWHRPTSTASTLGLGRSRIARGYLGSLAACIPIGVWMARDDGRFQVARHYISAADAARYQFGWSLEFISMTAYFTVVLITAVGLPILMLLRKVRLVSVIGAMCASLSVACLLSCWVGEAPVENMVIFLTITAGFVLAAQLPWIRSAKV
jgi:hypothetical protein